MYQECRHIMPTGAKCHSPAMRGMAYCYFHRPGRRPALGQSQARKRPLKLPPLTDRYGVQVAISQVLNALVSSKISPRAAGQILFGLQTASDMFRLPGLAGRPPKPECEKADSREQELRSQELEAES